MIPYKVSSSSHINQNNIREFELMPQRHSPWWPPLWQSSRPAAGSGEGCYRAYRRDSHAGSALVLSHGCTCSWWGCGCFFSVGEWHNLLKAKSQTNAYRGQDIRWYWTFLICYNLCPSIDLLLTSRASVMMQPITAHTRSVPSISSLRREDLSWSMGTNQAPMAGVAVLSRFNCL